MNFSALRFICQQNIHMAIRDEDCNETIAKVIGTLRSNEQVITMFEWSVTVARMFELVHDTKRFCVRTTAVVTT